jgi:hypothetical protein
MMKKRVFLLCIGLFCSIGSLIAASDLRPAAPEEVVTPVIRTRAEWGAQPFVAEKMKPHRLTRGICIHHSEGRAPKPGEENQIVRNIQDYHMSQRKWGDAAYHYFICPSGLILEGRSLDFAGDTGTVYDTAGLEQICLLGSYMNTLPTPEALKALSALVRRDMKTYGFKNDQIFAHRELAQTDCPGNELYRWYKEVFFRSF